MPMNEKTFSSLKEFYPYYLAEHRNPQCRMLHFIGSTGVLILLFYVLLTQQWVLAWGLPLIGYGCAWLGHLLFEKNKPATFKHPWYSFLGDWIMYGQILRGKLSLFR